ncbi:RadC family protein [Rubellicoccus peritrichatus]|uniref:DNA repair protein RadC n=1 Tax=Rubellicoccus peritrichatus TaxID=3080537 RepID=A0AAQ3L944_9BACT|nr:DNA repair protein RadC [Puniceicoccus sp. CR14]WOO39565.1 DNA repair protein RadC [Puniceicoccus sp. CR14]
MNIYKAPRLSEMAVSERPQERLEQHGAKALSDTELLAMILRSGSRELDVLGLSSALLSRAGSLAGLLLWSETDFKRIKGIGQVKALQLITIMEMARRISRHNTNPEKPLDTPESVYNLLEPEALGMEIEKFWMLCLNRKNRLIKLIEVTSGTASASLIHPREAFREAIRHGACSVIAAHNHPSGDPSPSRADIQVTRQLREAGSVIDIPLLDHVIVGNRQHDPNGEGYYSFSEAGLL